MKMRLFGVRIEASPAAAAEEAEAEDMEEDEDEEVMRKSRSTGNLQSCTANQNQHQHLHNGYLSDNGLLLNSRARARHERKRGVPWTEEEHRKFLAGLEKLGKGDWRGISRNFVITRTPTQVASHAQKYFLRQTNPNKKKRRSSLFDVGINHNATPTPPKTPSNLSLKKIDVAAERTNHQSKENYLPSLVATKEVARGAETSQALSMLTNNSITPNIQSARHLGGNFTDHQMNSYYCPKLMPLPIAPDFLQLSLPSFPTQQIANSPTVEYSSDRLELSIAQPQPQPHRLAELPSHCALSSIWVT